MGFLSKKDYICEKCGKTFQKRINRQGNICDECYSQEISEIMKLRSTILGYTEYARKVMLKSYSSDEMRQIIDRREDIIEKYMNEDGISRSDLQIASNNYKKLTDEQALEVLMRIESASVSATMDKMFNRNYWNKQIKKLVRLSSQS